MKILELEIFEFRGVRKLSLKPGGKNLVIWGENGTGKSAIVDALDFLLTGQISRLTGKGTAGITLSKHGPHVDHGPDEAIVKAKISLPGISEPINISRCVGKPSILECDKKYEKVLRPIIDLAEKRQYVLTRREILKYVTSEASYRAQGIQELLDLNDIEDVRTSLVRVVSNFETETKSKNSNLESIQKNIAIRIGAVKYNKTDLKNYVNGERTKLGAKPIDEIKSSNIKDGISSANQSEAKTRVNTSTLSKDLTGLAGLITIDKDLFEADTKIRTLLSEIKKDSATLKLLSQEQLNQLGLKLIDDDISSCPLCDNPWEPEALRKHIQHKLEQIKEVTEKKKEISEHSIKIITKINSILSILDGLVLVARDIELTDELAVIESWTKNLLNLKNGLNNALEDYPIAIFGVTEVQIMLAPEKFQITSDNILNGAVKKFPDASPSQIAWDNLTRLEEQLSSLESASSEFKKAITNTEFAKILQSKFQTARDKILQDIYDSIKNRFIEFYKTLHEHEANFDANLTPDGAGLDFEVDFYAKGKHPPQALHSEGHQDSMGICLYLALTEKLISNRIDLIVLDDVVMSIDSNHRRRICALLLKYFKDKQFLITTHDEIWARQLNSLGVVERANLIEFSNWDVESGPDILQGELWNLISEDLDKKDVLAASSKLRKGSENFLSEVCGLLEAPVRFRTDHKWFFGDFLPAARSQLEKYFTRGILVASRKKDASLEIKLNELKNKLNANYKTADAEKWAINSTIHGANLWQELTVEDLRPIADSFKTLFNSFVCPTCKAIYNVAVDQTQNPVSLRCNCSTVCDL